MSFCVFIFSFSFTRQTAVCRYRDDIFCNTHTKHINTFVWVYVCVGGGVQRVANLSAGGVYSTATGVLRLAQPATDIMKLSVPTGITFCAPHHCCRGRFARVGENRNSYRGLVQKP